MTESNVPGDFLEKYPQSVVKEKFTRIWEKVNEKWGTQDCVDFLDDLTVMEGDKDRQGFDLTVMSELLCLGDLHNKLYPEFAVKRLGDAWDTDLRHD
jgi:hypothetical protein